MSKFGLKIQPITPSRHRLVEKIPKLGLGGNLENPRRSGNCQIKVPTGRFGYQHVQNLGANNFGFWPQSGHSIFFLHFFWFVFPNGGTLAQLGPMGGPWAPWGPWAHGPHGPHGAHGGPMGPHWANVRPLGKTFFRKSTKKSGMSTLGSKTKVVRAEILHILVPKPSRGDLYLTISRVSIILTKLGFLVQFLMCSLFQVFLGGRKVFSAAKIDPSHN